MFGTRICMVLVYDLVCVWYGHLCGFGMISFNARFFDRAIGGMFLNMGFTRLYAHT